MTNQKIPTLPGTIVLVIIAVTVFSFVWVYEKNNFQNEIQISNAVIQHKTTQNIQAQSLVGEEFPTIQIQQGVSLEEIIKQAIYKNVPDWKIRNYDIKVTVETDKEDHAIGRFIYDGYNIVKDGKYHNTAEGIWFAAKTDNSWTLTNISYAGYNGSCQIFKKFNFPLDLTPDCWDNEKNIQIETKNPKRFYQSGITGKDKKEIEQAFVAYIKNEGVHSEFYLNKKLFVLIIRNTETYLEGMILVGGIENHSVPNFFAIKISNKWNVVFNGQDYPPCSIIEPYNFPRNMVARCYDIAMNDVRTPKLKISSIEKWKTFRDKKSGLELKYPPELSLNTSRQDIILGLYTISPNGIPDAMIMNQLIIYSKQEDINNIINKQKTDNPGSFTQKTVKVGNLVATQTSYRGAYAGELWVDTLISNGSNTIVASYPGDNQDNVDIFEKIIATIKL